MAELQLIPARHGTATFVPAGQTIKIVNTSGTQVIDTWAFALPKPEPKKETEPADGQQSADKDDTAGKQQDGSKARPVKKNKKSGGGQVELPSQEEAEQATREGMQQAGEKAEDANAQKSSWGSYVPSLGWSSSKKTDDKDAGETEQQKNSRTWASYFPSGKGFSNYIPKSANDTVSAFAASHKRDPNKSYIEQLQQFSQTPVGAAGWSGLAALTGSGYSGSMYAGYQAWNAQNAASAPPTEFMSMPHSRAATLHLRPRINDTLVSNYREPMLTLIEDTSSGIHDTLIAACDPQRYKGLGVAKWEEHGSCAENLVLALSELNSRAGLQGARGIGAAVTIDAVPAPLNLFMNIPWDDDGEISFRAPHCSAGAYVRFKAERDLVVVMSACPQDVLDINNKKPTDAHFVVEAEEDARRALTRTQPRKRNAAPPRKAGSAQQQQPKAVSAGKTGTGATPLQKSTPQKRTTAQKLPAAATNTNTSAAAPQPMKKKPVPPPVTPQTKRNPAAGSTQTATTTTANANGEPAAQKRKPRKLTPKT